ncbi:hypothetical protein ACLB2K_005586 [Fragaria x ananassa]
MTACAIPIHKRIQAWEPPVLSVPQTFPCLTEIAAALVSTSEPLSTLSVLSFCKSVRSLFLPSSPSSISLTHVTTTSSGQRSNLDEYLNAPDGPYAWGYCFVIENIENNRDDVYCTPKDYPCAPGKKYCGRGPIQLTHNYNYAQAGAGIKEDLLNNPDLVATDPVVAFKTAIWFWMTPQSNKPSSHDVITGRWNPSAADISAGRVPGYGVITNIINGGLECGRGQDGRVVDRIGFYRRYSDILGVSPGQVPFAPNP